MIEKLPRSRGRKLAIAAPIVALAVWIALGAIVRVGRAARPAPAPGEVRGAYHVHTNRSDGRGSLAEVVSAARKAGLQFVVVTDHNLLTAKEQGWHDGILVVEGTEVSTPFGHVVALGVKRALNPGEREGDPLGTIASLGGRAIIAHPFHPRRPFTGWGRGEWRGMEVVSNDTAWGEIVAGRGWGKAALAAAVLPFDGARAVLALLPSPGEELRRFDRELREAKTREDPHPSRVLLCAADAHGYPSYEAAFGAFSMHLPASFSGDGATDARQVVEALTDGRAYCVFDAVAEVRAFRLVPRGSGGLDLFIEAPDLRSARFTLLRDGAPVGRQTSGAASGGSVVSFDCEGAPCPPGDYRVEATFDGRPWIFTNPVAIDR